MKSLTLKKHGLGLVAAGLLLTLAGCSSSGSDSGDELGENEVAFAIAANGAQEVPANDSAASASGRLILDQVTGALSGTVTTDGIAATAAHIHSGFAGSNGGVVLQLEVVDDVISVPESTVITADQMESMLSGAYYLNIHSEAFLPGEIRSQISGADVEVIQVALSGDNEVPPVTTDATGTGYVTLNTETGALEVRVITAGIITPTVSHLHSAPAGMNGPVATPLVQDAAEIGNFSATGVILEADAITELLNGGMYINVHSDENAPGELRGQIQP